MPLHEPVVGEAAARDDAHEQDGTPAQVGVAPDVAADTVRITEGALDDGAPAEGGFLALYERGGRTTAVLPIDRPARS
ncbi:hypothetical protein [Streptomyces mirabilis]|uniref:hypothetical protein n=1 Tax=Streptomyces mirabilis TaxID=68239 RepID=UPI0036676C98